MSAFPPDFINSLKHIPGFDEEAFIRSHSEPAPTSIRINPFKKTELNFELGNRVPWATNAFYLKERPVFTADPLFHAGCYYVQEASSMFIEHALKQVVDFDNSILALDLCAAPGGKSTILSSLLNSSSLLVANEVVKSRADVLAYNLAKWGNCNHVVTNSETASFSNINALFDVVIVDAPCSGSGLFRKQEDAPNEWNLNAVRHCSIRQKDILRDVIPCLKQNAHLLYSTCSYSSAENEEIVKWLISEHHMELVPLKFDQNWGIEDTGSGYRFYPYKLQGEGFFCCVLKMSDSLGAHVPVKKNAFKEVAKADLGVISNFIELGNQYKVIVHNSEYKLINANCLYFINSTKDNLYFKSVGTPLGEIKHEQLIPHHFLAFSSHLRPQVESVELSDDEALKYLKKEDLKLPNRSNGLKRFTSKGFGLGWGKNLGNRINNYLPAHFQIFNKSIKSLN